MAHNNTSGASAGSTPLTRGKRDGRPERLRARRLIPAHAGKTRPRYCYRKRYRAHPRSRGENQKSYATLKDYRGSSPLTRGKRAVMTSAVKLTRLIPAHAGKTHPGRNRAAPFPAHPRSRGENRAEIAAIQTRASSSPLTRGKLPSRLAPPYLVRLIPAHAGKTQPSRRSCRKRPAHPRSRGENVHDGAVTVASYGSSPLTRGKLDAFHLARHVVRLIPAHAGKTPMMPRMPCPSRAHPRSRGENPELWSASILENGSSPLTRGKLAAEGLDRRAARLIPAHAGKTGRPRALAYASAAHPRSRGENVEGEAKGVDACGSSPLTRGKRATPRTHRRRQRLIPAHAGKTGRCHRRGSRRTAHPRSRGENISL